MKNQKKNHLEKKEIKKAFVIGEPISHSLSPKLHQFWIKKYQMNASYEAIEVSIKNLPSFIENLQKNQFLGGNVTIPLKENMFKFCEKISKEANDIGAINTLYYKNGQLYGDNSDYIGFLKNLDQQAKDWDENADKKHAIIIGAGGAARAIIYALIKRNFSHIHILNRTKPRALDLSKSMSLYAPKNIKITAHDLDEFNILAPNISLVINTSSVGMKGTSFKNLKLKNLPKEAIINDIVYTPINTPLLNDAQNLGLKTVDGLGMLLHQAVLGFEKWFGVKPEVDEDLKTYMLSLLGEK